MKITILSIGKFENSPHKAVFEAYLKRMKWSIDLKEIELKNSNNLSDQQIKTLEAKLLIKSIKSGSIAIALDENGKQFSSNQFAKMLSDFSLHGDSNLCFMIGGAHGLGSEILNMAKLKISLGLMTFPHIMVRSMLLEQLYRAQTIIGGHPYHKN